MSQLTSGKSTAKSNNCHTEGEMFTRLSLTLLAAALALLFLPALAAAYTVVGKDEVAGAEVVTSPWQVPLEEKMIRVAPDPGLARDDIPQTTRDGCMAFAEVVVHPPCVYGNPQAETRVVLFGDSRAQQFFPALEALALENDWRLTVLVRGNCTPALVIKHEYFCDLWRKKTVERIVKQEKPDLTILGTATKASYTVVVNGKRLSRQKSQPYLVQGMKRTIKKIRAAGSQVLVLRDQSLAPFLPSLCAASYPEELRRCSFVPGSRKARAFELVAAKDLRAKVIDPQSMFCSALLCPAVVGEALVHRDVYHITDTYALTMKPWFAKQLKGFPLSWKSNKSLAGLRDKGAAPN